MSETVMDVKNKSLGRAATEIALILQGKDKTSYEQRKIGGNIVRVKNISELKFTGRKLEQKTYYRHTGFMGHLKSKTLEEAFAKSPEWVLRHAVRGMLPKNSLLPKRLKLLVIDK